MRETRLPLVLGAILLGIAAVPPVPAQAARPASFTLPAGTTGTKWFPGHYLRTISAELKLGDVEQFLAHPSTAGLLVQIDWKNLESRQGVYDFSRLDYFLELCGKHGKVMQLKIQDRGFHGETDANAPAYLSAAGHVVPMYKTEQGRKRVKGSAIKWWEPACMDRFIALYQALGERYNLDRRFAGITVGDGESALAVDKGPGSGYSQTAHREQIIRAAREVKAAFPNTPVFTGFNWMDEASMKAIAAALKEIGGSGFIHPDTVPGKKFGFATDIEIAYGKMGVPTFAQFQTPHLTDAMTEAEIFDWAVTAIGAPMVCWNHYRPQRPGYVVRQVLPFLSTAAARFPARNLSCPATWAPCLKGR